MSDTVTIGKPMQIPTNHGENPHEICDLLSGAITTILKKVFLNPGDLTPEENTAIYTLLDVQERICKARENINRFSGSDQMS